MPFGRDDSTAAAQRERLRKQRGYAAELRAQEEARAAVLAQEQELRAQQEAYRFKAPDDGTHTLNALRQQQQQAGLHHDAGYGDAAIGFTNHPRSSSGGGGASHAGAQANFGAQSQERATPTSRKAEQVRYAALMAADAERRQALQAQEASSAGDSAATHSRSVGAGAWDVQSVGSNGTGNGNSSASRAGAAEQLAVRREQQERFREQLQRDQQVKQERPGAQRVSLAAQRQAQAQAQAQMLQQSPAGAPAAGGVQASPFGAPNEFRMPRFDAGYAGAGAGEPDGQQQYGLPVARQAGYGGVGGVRFARGSGAGEAAARVAQGDAHDRLGLGADPDYLPQPSSGYAMGDGARGSAAAYAKQQQQQQPPQDATDWGRGGAAGPDVPEHVDVTERRRRQAEWAR